MSDRTFQAQPGPQTTFLSTDADIAIYGGARGGGKSYGLLLDHLRHVQSPDYGGVIFRRTNPQIFQEGGLWDTSELIYPYAGASGSAGNAQWKFPSGATITFRHMENEKDRFAWLGAQIPDIGFDELATFTEKQFFFMLGSNRDPYGKIKPYIRASTNPEADTWLSRLLQWYWDPETGYAIDERGGVIRWFVRPDGDQIIWGDTAQELKERFPGVEPKSFTFIPARVQDNKILMAKDPAYLSNLMAQGIVDRERYLKGNWKIKLQSGMMFRREWFKYAETYPADVRLCRFWDRASTEAKEGKEPDWTAGIKMGEKDGVFYLIDVRRLQGTPMQNAQLIRGTAVADTHRTMVRMEQEGGSSGIDVIDRYAREILMGFNFLGVRTTGSKVERAGLISAAVQAGNVVIVRGPWNQDFIDELEAFPLGSHDDQVDALSGAHSILANRGAGQHEVVKPQESERFAGRGKILI